jgi:hypothetical protein
VRPDGRGLVAGVAAARIDGAAHPLRCCPAAPAAAQPGFQRCASRRCPARPVAARARRGPG